MLELKKTKTFLNKGTKHKKHYMEGLNSKNKNIKCVGSPLIMKEDKNGIEK